MRKIEVTITREELEQAGSKKLSALPFHDLKELHHCMKNEWQAEDGKMRTFWNKIFNSPKENFRLSEEDQQQAREWMNLLNKSLQGILEGYLPQEKPFEEHPQTAILGRLIGLPPHRKNDWEIIANAFFVRNCFESCLEEVDCFLESQLRVLKEDRGYIIPHLDKLTEASENAYGISRRIHQLIVKKTFLSQPFQKPRLAYPESDCFKGPVIGR